MQFCVLFHENAQRSIEFSFEQTSSQRVIQAQVSQTRSFAPMLLQDSIPKRKEKPMWPSIRYSPLLLRSGRMTLRARDCAVRQLWMTITSSQFNDADMM